MTTTVLRSLAHDSVIRAFAGQAGTVAAGFAGRSGVVVLPGATVLSRPTVWRERHDATTDGTYPMTEIPANKPLYESAPDRCP